MAGASLTTAVDTFNLLEALAELKLAAEVALFSEAIRFWLAQSACPSGCLLVQRYFLLPCTGRPGTGRFEEIL